MERVGVKQNDSLAVELQPVRGMRDFSPEKTRKQLFLRNQCIKVFNNYGFEQLQTPIVEHYSTISVKGGGGKAIKDEIYFFKDKSGRELGLRFDLTIPLARFIAKNPQLPKPFKRYAIGKVFRYDRPGKNRYREFVQADADIIGSDSVLADFEVTALAIQILKDLKISFCIRVNNQKILKEVARYCKIPKEKTKECLICIDKLDKIGVKGVKEELAERKISPMMFNLLRKTSFEEIKGLVKQKKGFEELEELVKLLEKENLAKNVKIDLCLARGLDYYTGNMFEIVAKDFNASIGAGGRYDNLIGLFSTKKEPAVGISLGIDRIFDLLENKIEDKNNTKVFVAPIGKKAQLPALKLTQKIRKLGINTTIDLNSKSLHKNMRQANKKGIPFTIILGEKEINEKKFLLKEMKTGKETKIKTTNLKELPKFLEEDK